MVLDALRRRIRRTGDNPATEPYPGNWWGRDYPWTYSVNGAHSNGGASGTLGPAVTDMTALSLTAVYRALELIASTVGGLPMQVFEEEIDANGVEGATVKLKPKEAAYLWHRPNREMTRQSFWERIVADEMRGNAFIFVIKNSRGGVVQEADVKPGEDWGIWYIERGRVKVGRLQEDVANIPAGTKIYQLDDEEDPRFDYSRGGEIVHIPNWGNGLVGYDPIKIAAQAFSLGLAAGEYAARFFSQGGGPDGLITTDQTLTAQQAKDLVKLWAETHGGVRNAHGTGFLGNGAKYQQISVDADKAQLVQLRGFQVAEIARLFGLPTHLLAAENTVSTWGSGMEEQNRMLFTFNFQGHVNRIEQAISDDLLKRATTNRYIRMNADSLLRGSTLQRNQAYKLADYMTVNEKRAKEELPPVDGGDDVLAMTNLAPLDQLEEIALNAGNPAPAPSLNGAAP